MPRKLSIIGYKQCAAGCSCGNPTG